MSQARFRETSGLSSEFAYSIICLAGMLSFSSDASNHKNFLKKPSNIHIVKSQILETLYASCVRWEHCFNFPQETDTYWYSRLSCLCLPASPGFWRSTASVRAGGAPLGTRERSFPSSLSTSLPNALFACPTD